MRFTHIHTSSRFNRSAANLERATDRWHGMCDLITFTEVSRNDRTRAIAEKGWGYYSQQGEVGMDECATSWKLDTWQVKYRKSIRLTGRWKTYTGGTRWAVYANTVLLQHKTSGHTLLVSTAHMPNKIGGKSGFVNKGQGGASRIASYKQAVAVWNRHVEQLTRTHKPDMILVNADWNINFRLGWVRKWTLGQFKGLRLGLAWKRFTSRGTFGGAVIDGSLYRGMSTNGSLAMVDVGDSSDHNPYITSYATIRGPRNPISVGGGGSVSDPVGGTKHGKPWWNFEDYGDETVYKFEEA